MTTDFSPEPDQPDKTARFGKIWEWFIVPLGPIEGEERRINARWLAMVLVLLLPLGLIVAAIRALVDPAPSLAQERGIVAIAIAFILWIIPYFLSRIGRLHMTTLFIVATASIGIFFAAIFSNEPIDLFYLLLPILFGSVLLPRRIIWALATASTAVMLLIPLFRPEMSFQEHLHDPLGFFLIGVALTLLISHHRQTLEQFRTGELIQANRSLQDEIAERKQAEQAEREQRILGESLRDTAAAINSTLELDEVLDRILTSVSLVVPHDTCEIMLVENGVASVVRCRGYAERGGEQVAFSLHLPVTETVNLAQMADTQEPLIIPDVRTSAAWTVFPGFEWMRAFLGAPICIGDQLIGFLNLDSTTPNAFTQDHQDRLKIFADQAAIAIQNARLFQILQESEARLKAVTGALPDLAFIYDEDGRYVEILAVNDELLYLERQRLLGQTIEDVFPEDVTDQIKETIHQTFETDAPQVCEYRLHVPAGERWFEGRTSPMPTGKGAKRLLVWMARDITERKLAAEQTLQLALERERLRLLQDFIGDSSHDLKTPLSVIMTKLHLLRKLSDSETQHRHLDVIQAQTTHLNKLIEDLFTMSRLDSGKALNLSSVHLGSLLQDVRDSLDTLIDQNAIQLIIDLEAEIPLIQADPGELHRAFANLIDNALRYTPGEGTVRVHAYTQEQMLVVDVQDTGIDPSDQNQIFKRFFRADKARSTVRGGTGLGLAIVHKIVEMHAGSVTVESTPGDGSLFRVKLPL